MHHNIFELNLTAFLNKLPVILVTLIALSFSSNTIADSAFKYNDTLVKLAREFDDPGTRYLVGRRFHKGTDYPLDKKQAAHWYLLAANAGHMKAQHYLGKMYLQGDGIEENYELGKKYLKLAAKKGYLQSMVELGDMYRLGVNGKKINFKNAAFWYKKAAEFEHADAAYYYGLFLYKGRGVERRKESAMEWLQLSAELGFLKAEIFLEKISNEKNIPSSNASTPSEEPKRIAVIVSTS